MLLETLVPKETARHARKRGGNGWGLLIATLLHIAVILAFVAEMKHSARIMGERDGDPDAITVDVTDGDTLAMLSQHGGQQPSAQDSSTQAAGAPAANAQAQPPRPEPQQPAQQQPAPAGAAKAAPKAQPDTEALEKEALAMLPLKVPAPGTATDAGKEQPATPKKQEPPKKQETAKAGPRATQGLDLSVPSGAMNPDMIMGPQSAGMSRPANITRSGENDDFGRGVIRALRQTMPLPRGALGRVTVRFLLTERGNLQELRVLESNTDPGLTQSVAFAVRQSSFPIPPARSTVADRTFVVTYLYR